MFHRTLVVQLCTTGKIVYSFSQGIDFLFPPQENFWGENDNLHLYYALENLGNYGSLMQTGTDNVSFNTMDKFFDWH